ncbi:MAG: META domain-containing protein, partial [Chitinophagaceae bacterium]
GDGTEDVVFLLTQNTGGSGTFYYVVGAVSTESGYVGSLAVLLGDRIAPQTTEFGENNIVVVNYADRALGEDFSIQPSVGKSIWLKLDTETLQFGEVANNFEGEADPMKMSLTMKTWKWISALYNDEREVKPIKGDAFTLTFTEDGKFTATTDCNQMGGSYTVDGEKIAFGAMYSTKMYCEGSQETIFSEFLTNTSGFHFTSKGEMILDLKFDSGSVVFR